MLTTLEMSAATLERDGKATGSSGSESFSERFVTGFERTLTRTQRSTEAACSRLEKSRTRGV